MTPGSAKICEDVAPGALEVGGRVVAQERQAGPARRRGVLAPGRRREVALRVEHVVQQRPHVPLVAGRGAVEVVCGSGNLGGRPLAGTLVEIQQVEFHVIAPDESVRRGVPVVPAGYPPPMGLLRAVEATALRASRADGPAARSAAVLSGTTRGGALWIALTAASLPVRSLRRAGRDGLAGWTLASAAAFGMKAVVDRRRPQLAGWGAAPKSSSMPSSHTAGAFAYAVAATTAAPVAGLVAGPIALGVAWSRIASQRHFPTDVAVGAAVGVAAGAAVHFLSTPRECAEPDLGKDGP